MEGDIIHSDFLSCELYFYPRPPHGGRPAQKGGDKFVLDFYPRPPHGGRRRPAEPRQKGVSISIHALRMEGDGQQGRLLGGQRHFYPRPPHGGRRAI